MNDASTGAAVALDDWSAANLDALLYAISRDGTLTAPEALDRIEDLAAFGYEYGDNLLMSTVPRPAIEVVGVEPGAVRFRLIDADAAAPDASAAELAWREIPVTLEAGETLDALAPVEAQPTLEDWATGVFEFSLDTPAPTRFFRLRAGQDATTP